MTDSQVDMVVGIKEIESDVSEPETILEVDKLHFYYGNFRALTDISVKIFRNKITAIIGPYGAGKTCIRDCISGFYHSTTGRIFWEGKDITGLSVHRRAEKGIARGTF